jgi:uncharacterized repeat protein (TIGR01451 family)
VLSWSIVEDVNGLRLPVRAVPPMNPGNAVGDRGGFITGPAISGVPSSGALPPFQPRGDGTVTLSHSASMDIAPENAVACADGQTGTTRQAYFLRTFTLQDFGVEGEFDVESVTFGVENLTVATSVDVSVHRLEGSLQFANMTRLGGVAVELQPQQLQRVTVPLAATVPAGGTFVLMIEAPDLAAAGGAFFPGSNAAGQTAPSWLASAGCDTPEPVTTADVGAGHVHWVMAVTGTADAPLDCALPDWLGVQPDAGTVVPLGVQQVTVGFDAGALAPGNHQARLCVASNDPSRPLSVVPVDLTVLDAAPMGDVLVAVDGAASDWFGREVAIDGDTALVGADAVDVDGVSNRGAAYVFVRSGDGWLQQAKLVVDGEQFDQFGISVALSGDTAVIGQAGDGGAHVFVREGGAWSRQAVLTGSDTIASDRFGIAVAIDGDTIVVGAREADVEGRNNQGAAYVFVRSGDTWTEQAKLVAPEGAAYDLFGDAVAIDGNTIVAGAASADPDGMDARGAAYAFARNGTSWTAQGRLVADDGAAGDRYGDSVTVSGDTIVVGAALANGARGAAYVHVRNGGAWTQQARLVASSGVGGDMFGYAVAMQGDRLLVGAPFVDGQGAAYVFRRAGDDWSAQETLTAGDPGAGDQVGNAVALDAATALVAAWQADVDGKTDQGVVHVFALGGGPGTGTLSVTPDTIDFGGVPAGASAGPAIVTVSSTGDVPVTVTMLDVPDAPFARTGGTCPATPFDLPPDSTCTLAYRFSPMSVSDFEQTLDIESSGGNASVVLAGTGLPGTPVELVVLGGDGQTATVGAVFAQPLAVQVRDGHGNPVPGVEVSFAAPGTGASAVLSAALVTTDGNGYAAVVATANGEAGSYAVSADAGSGSPVSFGLTNVAASADVAVTISPSREHVRPGQWLDYVVTVHNTGPDAVNGIAIVSTLSPLLDIAAATWQCLGPASSGCTAAGEGDLADDGLVLPPGGSVLYVLRSAVPPETEEGLVETRVDIAAPGDTNPANDNDAAATTMVLFRDGFQLYGDGTLVDAIATERLDREGTLSLRWPEPASDAGDGINAVLVAIPDEGPARAGGFRIERLHVAGREWARLMAVDVGMPASASHWLPMVPGAVLTLAGGTAPDSADGDEMHAVLMTTSASDRASIAQSGEPAIYRIRSVLPVRREVPPVD